jgi:hypothetical protein
MDVELHVSDGDVGRFFGGFDFPRPRLYGNVMEFTAYRSPDRSKVIHPQAAKGAVNISPLKPHTLQATTGGAAPRFN